VSLYLLWSDIKQFDLWLTIIEFHVDLVSCTLTHLTRQMWRRNLHHVVCIYYVMQQLSLQLQNMLLYYYRCFCYYKVLLDITGHYQTWVNNNCNCNSVVINYNSASNWNREFQHLPWFSTSAAQVFLHREQSYIVCSQLTSSERSFCTWSTIRDFSGETTMVTPDVTSAGNW